MATNTTATITDFLIDDIKKAMQNMAEEEFERAKEEMIQRLENKKAEVVSGIVINLMKYVNMHTLTDRLVIEIKKENN